MFQRIKNLSKRKLISWAILFGIGTVTGLLTYPAVEGKIAPGTYLIALGSFVAVNILWEVIKKKKEAKA